MGFICTSKNSMEKNEGRQAREYIRLGWESISESLEAVGQKLRKIWIQLYFVGTLRFETVKHCNAGITKPCKSRLFLSYHLK